MSISNLTINCEGHLLRHVFYAFQIRRDCRERPLGEGPRPIGPAHRGTVGPMLCCLSLSVTILVFPIFQPLPGF